MKKERRSKVEKLRSQERTGIFSYHPFNSINTTNSINSIN
jgi:hypothetical protein